MTIDTGTNTATNALDTQAAQLLKRTQTSSTASSQSSSKEDAKIEKAGKDFESILLGSWLQQAENTFASVPGGDEDDDGSSGKDQFQGIAMQALAGSITKSGGIGIARMITQHLHSAADSEKAKPSSSPEKRLAVPKSTL
jgi:Rod binding domain-containing protein